MSNINHKKMNKIQENILVLLSLLAIFYGCYVYLDKEINFDMNSINNLMHKNIENSSSRRNLK